MGASTGIAWTDATWNPVVGCNQISPGCAKCYAKALHDRRHKAALAGKSIAPQYWYPFERVRVMYDRFDDPLHWRKPRRIFVNSVSDLFHDDVPEKDIRELFSIMGRAHWHTFQILTKRSERLAKLSQSLAWAPNIWMGVSVENQHWAEIRIPHLLETEAEIKFLSCEPLLGPLELIATSEWSKIDILDKGIDWVICGGESGKGYRPMNLDWARSLRDQCSEASIPFFYKQSSGLLSGHGTLLDGELIQEFPAELHPSTRTPVKQVPRHVEASLSATTE
jgi:protein gp37